MQFGVIGTYKFFTDYKLHLPYQLMQCFVSVVNECRKVLSAAGFKELKEKEHWDIKPSDKVRNESWGFIFNLFERLQF